MGIVRKYNLISKEWEVIAASNASAISVRSQSLLDEGQEETNVESVLQKFGQEINTLKGNVSWLAEHGGGGSGGGGASTDAEIKVNSQGTGATIVLDSEGLNIVVQAKSSSLRWNLTISSGSTTIKTVTNVNNIKVTSDELDKVGLTTSFNLAIVAFNESTLTSVYWDGYIQRATVSLSTSSEVSFKFSERASQQIVYNYNVGVLDTYALYINEKKIGAPQQITTYNGEWKVNLSDIKDLTVGSNTLVATMQSVSTSTIKSSDCSSRVILIAESPIISCTVLSSEQSDRTPIYAEENTPKVCVIPYTVYYTQGSFKAQICSSKSEKIDWQNISTYKSYNTQYDNESYTISSPAIDDTLDITIYVLDVKSNQEYSQTFYGIITKPDYNLLDVGVTPIFSFQSFRGSIKNNQWKEENATLTIKNPNAKSTAIQASDNMSLRLQNASYGVITNNQDNSYYNSYFTSSVTEFTLSICYRADFHPDDNRTILQFASPDYDHLPAPGIIIRDHKLYIQQNTFTLEDQELLDIAITYKQIQGSNSGKVFIYINGVVESVIENVAPKDLIPSTEKNMYIAAQVEGSEFMYPTDVSIYRVSLYNTCLNPLQVLKEYLNDQAQTHLKEGSPDSDYINQGLKRNFITSNGKSLLYDEQQSFDNNSDNYNNNFTFTNLITNSGIRSDISNYSIPIPLMYIDVSQASSWTWDNFITPNTSIGTAGGCNFQYYDQNGTNQSIIQGTCDVELQGTSTLSDAIKNLQITFSDNTIFIPKETWFPENTYTLKADIVDSSHSLNTSIGKFVNTELGLDDQNASWYPFSETVKNSFIKQKQNSSSAISTYFPKATLKHGVEGFPFFLILKFRGVSDSDNGLHSMGIYQFILGRKSPRNLGYEVINKIEGITENKLTYPYYNNNVTISVTENKGYWIEMGRNESFSENDKFQEKDSLTDSKLTGLFWQEDKKGGYYNSIAEIKYTNMGSDKVSTVSQFKPFTDFVHNVVQLPVTNRRYCTAGASTLTNHTFTNTSYPIYNSINTESGITWTKGEGNNQVLGSGDNLTAVLSNLNISCYAQYFVICQLFGLIDNFIKNMPLKFYQKADKTWEAPLLGIYDTDSGLGADNEAELKVSESVWLSTIKNNNGIISETSDKPASSTTYIIGQNNKLWYFDSDAVHYSGYSVTTQNVSLFTSQWNSLINHLKNKYENTEYAITSLEDVVTLYYDKYFIPQTEGCGELLFNLTYFTKYLNKYSKDGSSINQAAKLHGRRQQQVKRWLRNRVKFLDSMYTAMGYDSSLASNATPSISSLNVSINSGVGPSLQVTSNYPVVTKISHQGSNNFYVFLDKNVDTSVNWGASEISSQTYNHTVSYSDALQTLGNSEQTLKDIYFEKINSGALPYVTVFNAANCAKLSESNDATQYFKNKDKSELREIDLSNTAKTTAINYTLNLPSGYEKLQKLNLYNSCVSNILLPTGDDNIPLLTLDIRNSQIQRLDLQEQNLLSTLDLTGCAKLSNLKICNCSLLTGLTLDTSQKSLKNIEISSATFKEFACKSNDSVTSITINSSALSTVNITDCKNLTSLSISGDALQTLNLEGCSKLTELNISNPGTSINTLNLKGTALTYIKYNGKAADTNLLDLSCFKSIESFNIQGNNSVQYIQFSNNKDNPINITNKFNNSNLYRVYGYINIKCNSVFQNCSKFSIHGSEQAYARVTMVSNGVTNHFTEKPNTLENGYPKFQEGNKVTNFKFGTSDGNSNFTFTSCTLLDVYYVFCLGTLTMCEWMFRGVKTLNFTWSNSLHRNTFQNSTHITSLNWCFRETGGILRIYSPAYNNGAVTKDDGLFSPLLNCKTMSGIFYDTTVYCDRFMLRRTSGDYAITSLHYWPIKLIVDDVNNLTSAPNSNYLTSNYSTLGNLQGFFENLGNLTALRGFMPNTYLIDYASTGELQCPAESYDKSFVSTYATGEIKFSGLFKYPEKITEMMNSFTSDGDSNSDSIHKLIDKATFKITSTMLDKFTSLNYWGYNEGGNFVGSLQQCPFTGSEIIRTIDESRFPYSIFSKNTGLIILDGFFKDVQANFDTTVELPDTLFTTNTKLRSIKGLFYNTGFKFKLSSEGFKNCTNLQKVDYLFQNSEANFTGSIPNKFFYHGGQPKAVTYTGANLWNSDKSGYTYDPTKYTDEGTQVGIKSEDFKTISVTYFAPNATITSMQYCFSNCNIGAYENSNPESENNSEYLPLTHIQENGVVKQVTYNDKETTCMWSYDGVTLPDSYSGENLDAEYSAVDSKDTITYFTDKTITNDTHFICAPDLLRYCTDNANVQGLFSGCGYSGNKSWTYANHSEENYGLKGRLVPYLLKPVSNTTNLSYMFCQCSLVSTYTTSEGKSYWIPQTFFSYAPRINTLQNTFRGVIFPGSIDLNVFTALTQTLNITRIFQYCKFNGTSTSKTNISSIFKNKSISALERAFSVNNSNSEQTIDNYAHNQYVTFSDIFTLNKIARNADKYVFDGYGTSYVEFGTKTLDTAESKCNYRTFYE